MVAGQTVKIRASVQELSYAGADALAKGVLAEQGGARVLLDLDGVGRTSTAALARLVGLRRRLLEAGGDLEVIVPQGQARRLYDVCRFDVLLPNAVEGAEGVGGRRESSRRFIPIPQAESGFISGLLRALGRRMWAWAGGNQ